MNPVPPWVSFSIRRQWSDLVIRRGGERPHGDAQRPDHLQPDVGSTDSLPGFTLEVVGVVRAQHKGPGPQVERIFRRTRSQVGKGKEARDVGIVHVVPISEAVHLVGPHLAVCRVGHHRVGGTRASRTSRARASQSLGEDPSSPRSSRDNLSELKKGHHGEVVGGDQEGEGRRVVGGPEDGDDEPHGPDGVSVSGSGHRVGLPTRDPLELVGSPAFLPLLLPEGRQDQTPWLPPFAVEGGGVPRGLPVGVGQSDGVAEGVDLPLSLVELRLHVRQVVRPRTFTGLFVEGVGVGVDENAPGLPVDDTPDELLQLPGRSGVRGR